MLPTGMSLTKGHRGWTRKRHLLEKNKKVDRGVLPWLNDCERATARTRWLQERAWWSVSDAAGSARDEESERARMKCVRVTGGFLH